MKRFTKTWPALALAALWTILASPAGAQVVNLARIEPGNSRFVTSVGLDPAVLTTVGYARGFGLGSGTAMWGLDLGMAVAEADVEDLRLRAGLQTTLIQEGGWRIAASEANN